MKIDGKALATEIYQGIEVDVQRLVATYGIRPSLSVILVGDDPASHFYVERKSEIAERLGIVSTVYRLSSDVVLDELINTIYQLNSDVSCHGILLQLPLPRGIDPRPIIELIDPIKDIDGVTLHNVGALQFLSDGMRPCTPSGVMHILQRVVGKDLSSKKAVIIGRSFLVGQPLATMLLQANATVTVLHSKTPKEIFIHETRSADILVAAAGKPMLVTAQHVKPGSYVIDVGTNRLSNGKMRGDVDYEAVKDIAAAITPVPGGVGPMTVAFVMKNIIKACQILLDSPLSS